MKGMGVKMKKKISVIISCSDSGDYIWESYLSLKKQTIGIEYLELILVNRGADALMWNKIMEIEKDCPESVIAINCEQYIGRGMAYHIGLSYAGAPFAAFIDGSDKLHPSMYQSMYCKAKQYQSDIVCCGYLDEYTEDALSAGEEAGEELIIIETEEERRELMLADSLGARTGNKLIRKDFLMDNRLFLSEDLEYESSLWDAFLSVYAGSICIIKDKLYYYHNFPIYQVSLAADEGFLASALSQWDTAWAEEWFSLYQAEMEYLFLKKAYMGGLQILFRQSGAAKFDEFEVLKQEIGKRIPNDTQNSYIENRFTDWEQLMLRLMKVPVSAEAFWQIANQVRSTKGEMQIFVATHTAFSPPKDLLYLPLHVGHACSEDLGYLGDDTGENISHLNQYYSELTGLYWIWKNYHDADFVGLCHYRRFFINEQGWVLNKADYMELLSKYDIIIATPLPLENETYYETFSKVHEIEDLEAIKRAIQKRYPEDYAVFQEVIQEERLFMGNLMVTSKVLLNEYARWLFTIFDEVSKEVDPDKYDAYHRRVYGFWSEELLYVWISARGLKWYGAKVGLSQEKAETITLRNEIYQLLIKREFEYAKTYCADFLKERGDVLLEGSDVSGNLNLLYQLVHLGAADPDTVLIQQGDTQDDILTRYLSVLGILFNVAERLILEEDKWFLKENNIPLKTLQGVCAMNKELSAIDLKLLERLFS